MTARRKGGRPVVVGPVGRAFRRAANEAASRGRPCPFCGAVVVDQVSGVPVDVAALPAGAVVVAVMEHEGFCPVELS